jgi:tetratricopeptide (TPR) repeat protein
MNRIALVPFVLATLGVAVAAPSGQAQIVKLENLTERLLRERVASYLQKPEAQAQLTPVRGLIAVSADQIDVTPKAGKPERVVWRYAELATLSPRDRDAVARVLRGVLVQVLGNHQGGLLADADAATVLKVKEHVPTAGSVEGSGASAGGGGAAGAGAGRGAGGGGRWAWTWAWQGSCCGPTVAVPVWYYVPARRVVAEAAPAPVYGPSSRRLAVAEIKGLDAPALYDRAVALYWDNDPEGARELLTRAVERAPRDARLWYFKALAERALGDTRAATASAQRGAALEKIGRADSVEVSLALERVQGPDRLFLRQALDPAVSLAEARQIAEAPIEATVRPAATTPVSAGGR